MLFPKTILKARLWELVLQTQQAPTACETTAESPGTSAFTGPKLCQGTLMFFKTRSFCLYGSQTPVPTAGKLSEPHPVSNQPSVKAVSLPCFSTSQRKLKSLHATLVFTAF